MSGWNFDMTQAPRGQYVTKSIKTPRGDIVEKQVHEPEQIIATDGHIVTLTRWLPPSDAKPGRWTMFGTKETPLAWQPWPAAPGGKDEC